MCESNKKNPPLEESQIGTEGERAPAEDKLTPPVQEEALAGGEDEEFLLVDSDTPEAPSALERLTDSLLDDWQERQGLKERQSQGKWEKKVEIVDIQGRSVGVLEVSAEDEEAEPAPKPPLTPEERRKRRLSLLESQELVMLPTPDLLVFPSVIAPLSVETEAACKAVEYALEKDMPLFIVAKRKADSVSLAKTVLYKTGCICAPVQAMRLPNGSFRLVVHGIVRARIEKITARQPIAKVRVSILEDRGLQDEETESALQVVTHQFRQMAALNAQISPELVMAMSSVHNPGQIADLVAANLNISFREKQSILDMIDVSRRLQKVSLLLSREIEILKIENKIQSKAEMEMARGHREYFLRQHLKAIQEELGEDINEDEDIRKFKEGIAQSGMPESAAQHALHEVQRLRRLSSASPDYNVVYTYLERLLQFPWQERTEDNLDLRRAQEILDREHYGLKEVKERILEFLAVRKLQPHHRGSILCFVGPPGVGKTSLGRSIASTMGRKFNRTSLGGVRDEAEIRGHRRTYVGAMPGRIIQAFCNAGTRNPVIMLDEIDKVGRDYRGDPSDALLEALDPEQNREFKHNYFRIPVDLSEAMFIMTANVLDTIPPALRDRMEIIRLSGYTTEEKLAIARQFLLPRQQEENGLTPALFNVNDEGLRTVIRQYTREAGVRGLEREIASLGRKVARKVAESKRPKRKLPTLGAEQVRQLLGVVRYPERDKIDPHPSPGSVQGLSWTQVGGEILTIEANVIPGKGKVVLTGSLGQVMKESARAALTWVRAFLRDRGVEWDYYKSDIHIHVPEGATPKDGPSAGVALACSLISAILGRPARQDIAMTGEITLVGKVMAIGGVKEKVLAAYNASIREVILPAENERYLEEIPEPIRQALTFHLVERAEEAVALVVGEVAR